MQDRVLIAGAGPVGLTLALLLHRAGVQVAVFEKRARLNTASRASTFHPPTLELLDRLGVLDDLLPRGVRVDRVAWLGAGQGLLAAMEFSALAGRTTHPFRWHFEQAELTPTLLKALPAGTVRFGAEVREVQQQGDRVTLRLADGSTATGGLAVAADGAGGALRQAAGIGIETGHYGHRVLRLVTPAPLEQHVQGLAGAGVAYVFDQGASISLLKMPGAWRIILRVPQDTADPQALAEDFRVPLLRRFLPGLGEALPVQSADVYGVAKGVAHAMLAGRVAIVGDAAHVTNTRGGMNMNAGLHDAATLAASITAGAGLAAWAALRERVTREHLVARTDRAVASGTLWLDDAIAAAADPEATRGWLEQAAMLDTARQGNPA